MHAVFLTFEFAGQDRELNRTFSDYAEALVDIPEMVTRTWMKDGSTIGGFYVFRSIDAAERFLSSARIRALALHPSVSDFYVRHFSTLGSIGAALPHSPVELHSSIPASGDACPVWQGELDHIAAQMG